MEKYIFFFSGHFPVSVTILGWSNAYGVSGNTAWHGLGQDFLPALDMFALQLTLASPRVVCRRKESMEKWRNVWKYREKKEAQREIPASRITM